MQLTLMRLGYFSALEFMVMYFLIALLEDCGYMARATVLLDPIFKRVGLSGKSVIPMVITTGWVGNGFVPGVIAVVIMIAIVVGLIFRTNKQFETEYKLKKAV